MTRGFGDTHISSWKTAPVLISNFAKLLFPQSVQAGLLGCRWLSPVIGGKTAFIEETGILS